MYNWICDRGYRADGIVAVGGCLTWTGVYLGYRHVSGVLQAAVSDLAANLRWVWQVGGGSWAGPLRWGLAASVAGMVWFLGVGAIEYLNRKDGNE